MAGDEQKKKKAAEVPTGDFDPEQLAPQVSKHGEDITAILKKIETIETSLTPDGFLILLEKMYAKDKDFDGFLSKVFINLMSKDENARKAIHEFIKTDDKSAVMKIIKLGGKGVVWIISLLIAGFIGHLWQ